MKRLAQFSPLSYVLLQCLPDHSHMRDWRDGEEFFNLINRKWTFILIQINDIEWEKIVTTNELNKFLNQLY